MPSLIPYPRFHAELSQKEFFIVRHGKTKSNEEGKIGGGGIDSPLTEEGEHQAERLNRVLLTLRYEHPEFFPDYIIHTGLVRTSETARIANAGIGLEVFKEEFLKERDCGNTAEKQKKFYFKGSPVLSEGEEWHDFSARVHAGMLAALTRHRHQGIALIIAHHGTIDAIVEGGGMAHIYEMQSAPENAVLYHFKPKSRSGRVGEHDDFAWEVIKLTFNEEESNLRQTLVPFVRKQHRFITVSPSLSPHELQSPDATPLISRKHSRSKDSDKKLPDR